MSSTIYTTKDGRRARRQRNFKRRYPTWVVLTFTLGAVLVILAGVASAAIVLHGRGVLRAAPVQNSSLQVDNVRLSRALLPGSTADLLFSVRNPNAFAARIDRVTLVGGLRKAAPAGCTGKVRGLAVNPAGYRLPHADQVLVGAGAKKNVAVHAAFTLAGTAKTGCGFVAEVDVSATQLTAPISPTATKPTTAPTSTGMPRKPTTAPTTTKPPIASPTTQATPPTATPSAVDCELQVDPDCVTA